MRKAFVLFVTLAFCVSILGAADISFSGQSSFGLRVGLPSTENGGDISKALLSQGFELDAYGGPSSLYLNGGFNYDALNSSLSLFLSEAYADFYAGSFSFRLGRQKATWGSMEISSAVDIISPSDVSDIVSTSKLGIDALKVSYDAFPYAFDFYWIPFFTPSTLPTSLPISKPEASLKNGEFAVRASAYTSEGDFMLYGYYGWEDTPSLSTFEYERQIMIGASAAVPVGEVTVKGEVGFYPERDVILSGAAGAEWIKEDLTLIAEIYGEWDKENKDFTAQAGGSIGYSLLDGELEFSLSGIVQLEDLDGAILASCSYALNDEIKLNMELVYVFEETYKNLSCVNSAVTYSF